MRYNACVTGLNPKSCLEMIEQSNNVSYSNREGSVIGTFGIILIIVGILWTMKNISKWMINNRIEAREASKE